MSAVCKPCPTPWCDTVEKPYIWQGPDDKYCVICPGCQVEGPYCDTVPDAEEAWDARVKAMTEAQQIAAAIEIERLVAYSSPPSGLVPRDWFDMTAHAKLRIRVLQERLDQIERAKSEQSA